MRVVCVLTRDPRMVPCDECCEDHCGEPGCHAVHACWPCYMEYDDTYLPHGGPDVCDRHAPVVEAARKSRVKRMHAMYRRRH